MGTRGGKENSRVLVGMKGLDKRVVISLLLMIISHTNKKVISLSIQETLEHTNNLETVSHTNKKTVSPSFKEAFNHTRMETLSHINKIAISGTIKKVGRTLNVMIIMGMVVTLRDQEVDHIEVEVLTVNILGVDQSVDEDFSFIPVKSVNGAQMLVEIIL